MMPKVLCALGIFGSVRSLRAESQSDYGDKNGYNIANTPILRNG